MWSAPIPFIPKSRGASWTSQLVSAKKQINFVREKGGSILEEPVVRLANLLEITNNSKDRNSNGGYSFHLVLGPEESLPEDQVNAIGDVHVLRPASLRAPSLPLLHFLPPTWVLGVLRVVVLPGRSRSHGRRLIIRGVSA